MGRTVRRRNRQEGVSLIVTLLILLFLIGLGLSVVYYSSLQVSAARNINARQQAMNAAMAGLQHARRVLANQPNYTVFLTGQTQSANDPVRWDGTLGKVVGVGNVVWDGSIPLAAATTPGAPGTNPGLPYPLGCQATLPCTGVNCCLGRYTVWIRNDASDVNAALASGSAAEYVTDHNGTAILRALGRDPGNTATVVLEAAVVATTGTGTTPDNFAFGKNLDRANSNAMKGVRVNY
jgi:hypothetical protein